MRLQILISGAGSTLKNLIEHFPNQIVRVVADRQCDGLMYAESNHIDFAVIKKKDFPDVQSWSDALLDCDADLHILAGFLSKICVTQNFEGKILNIHPSIDEKYSGKGWYGLRVQQAIVQNKEKFAGCIVHTIDNDYDKGVVLRQESFALTGNETPEEVMSSVQNLERKIFPETIKSYWAKKCVTG